MKDKHHLLRNALLNDPREAVNIIYKNYYYSLYGCALRILNDPHLAKDIVQLGIINVWLKADTYDGEKSNPFTWIYNIVKNKAIDETRKIKDIPVETVRGGCVVMNTETIDLRDHINTLSFTVKEVIEQTLLGYTQEQISRLLQVPLGTVKSRQKIGKRELKKIYSNSLNSKKRNQEETAIIFFDS